LNSKSNITIVGVVLLILGVFFWLQYRNKNKHRYDWSHTYEETSKEPYGAYMLYHIMKDEVGDKQFKLIESTLSRSLPVDSTTKSVQANYIFIGESPYQDSTDTEKLLSFVSKGGDAMLAVEVLPKYLFESIYFNNCTPADTIEMELESAVTTKYKHSNRFYLRDIRDSICSVNLLHSELKETANTVFPYFGYGYKAVRNDYQYFDTLSMLKCGSKSTNALPLGTLNNNYINFVKIKYGQGSFYIHTNPILFTNFQLVDSNKLRYASKIFGHLKPQTTYWDDKSRITNDAGNRRNGNNKKLNNKGPLKYILSQKSLAWAWFILIGGILLYLFFYIKRRQNAIPIRDQKANSSLDFIQTMGRLYFNKKQHGQLASYQIKHFRIFVRDRYKISTPENETQEWITSLAMKSGIAEANINDILIYENEGDLYTLKESALIDLYQKIDYFYKNCK
jgi:hypothetical protein